MTSIPGQATPTSRRSQTTRQVLWFVLALAFIDGAVFNFLPVSFPAFKLQFRVSMEQLGRTQLCFFLSSLLYGLVGGWFAGRMGLRRATVGSVIALMAGLLIVGGAPVFAILLLGAFLFGFGLAAVEVLSNAIISEEFSEKRQSIFFIWGVVNAVGAALGPVGLGRWIRTAEVTGRSWRLGYFAVAATLLAFIVWGVLLSTQRASRQQVPGTTKSVSGSYLADVLRRPAIYGLGIIMLLHGVSQCGMVSWVGQLYMKRHGVDAAQAAYFISFNSGGFFVGRSVLSWITARWQVPELVVLGVCSAGGTMAFIGTLAAPSYAWGLAIFTVAGIFISGNGPSSYSSLGLRFAGQAATAFAVMNGIACIGAAVGPYLVGIIGNHFGLEKGVWFLPVFSLSLSAMALIWHRLDRKAGVGRSVQAAEANLAPLPASDLQ